MGSSHQTALNRNRNMVSEALLLFVLMMSSVPIGKTSESLFSVRCEPEVGVIGQITNIFCRTEPKISLVYLIVLNRLGEKQPCFIYNRTNKSVSRDSRFKIEHPMSLQLHNTVISDEGEYEYLIRTSQGSESTKFTINVTAKYSNPVINSAQEEMVNDGAADLLCNASRGYPAGSIHWFDQSNTNWTKSATLQTTQGDDGLFNLSSKLSFRRFDSLWAPFRCVVLNSKYEEEGGCTSTLKIKEDPEKLPEVTNNSLMRNGVAAVVVIGSLVVGLLIVIFFKGRRVQQRRRASVLPILSFIDSEDPNPEEEDALNNSVYRNSSETDQNIAV